MVAVSLGLDTSSSYDGGSVNTSDTSYLVLNESWSLNQSTWPSEFDNEDLWMNITAKRLEARRDDQQDVTCSKLLQLLLIVKTALLAVALLLEIAMAWLALRGTMWNVHPRRFMEYVLYTRLRMGPFFFQSIFLSTLTLQN